MIEESVASPLFVLAVSGSCLVAAGCHPNAAPSTSSFPTDRTAFFGASRCAAANVQLCEDFEAGTLDDSLWQVTGAVPLIDDVHAARGSRALHVTVSGKGSSYIKETRTFPAPNDTYFGRAFFYFQSLRARRFHTPTGR